ncbi:uncharacterized protein [Narcine bancroftii]|uniref:uncharacterized protein isoform X2 n=1 Tax=Narcine bancroftii TaxID=1343680 RepID=UPI0038319B8A
MDKALVDEVPTYNHWTSRNYVIHKRWSLNDTKTSSVQQDLSNSVYRLHSEEIKSGSQAVKRISHLGSIVSKRRAFFESAMKLPVPFTQEQVKCSRDPSTLKACNPNTAGTCHLLKDGGNEEIMTNKSEESNRLGPIQKHPAAEKRGQLIGLYQAICEKVRQSSYDSRQNISEEVDKEKVSPTLQDRLRCLLIEESSNQEEHEVRSKHQNPQQNDCSYDSVTESSISRHPSLKPLNKYQKTQFLESKSAFNHKKKDPIARVSAAANSWQRRSPLAKVPGRPPLNITANNELWRDHRDVFNRTTWENETNENSSTFPANQDCETGSSADSETANKTMAACWQVDPVIGLQPNIRVGMPHQTRASETRLALQNEVNSLHRRFANQSGPSLALCCEVNLDQDPNGRVLCGKRTLNKLFLQDNPKQQKRPVTSRLQASADSDRLEKGQLVSTLGLCSLPTQKTRSLYHLESMKSEGVATDEVIQSQSDNHTEDSNARYQFKSLSLSDLTDDGEQEFDSPGWSSSFQTPSGDIKPSESLTMSQMEDIRQHLQSLEANFQELVALLSRDRGTVAARRKLKQKGQSTVKNGKPWAQLKLQRQKDICIVQRRFAHLEAHILLLVRNIAHLTEEVGSQNFLLQKIHSFQLKIKKTEKAFNEEVWNPKRLSMKQDSSSTLECSQYGGESPSMLTIFLKKLGCEEKGRKGSGRSTDRKSANLWHMTMHRTDVAEGSKSNLSRFVADHSTQALRSTFQERWHKLHRSSFL